MAIYCWVSCGDSEVLSVLLQPFINKLVLHKNLRTLSETKVRFNVYMTTVIFHSLTGMALADRLRCEEEGFPLCQSGFSKSICGSYTVMHCVSNFEDKQQENCAANGDDESLDSLEHTVNTLKNIIFSLQKYWRSFNEEAAPVLKGGSTKNNYTILIMPIKVIIIIIPTFTDSPKSRFSRFRMKVVDP